MDSINTGVAGQIPCLEAKDSGPANHASACEQKTVLPAGGGPPRPSPYGTCPSCGYPRDLAAFEFCSRCTLARQDEEDEGPHDLPMVRMAKEIGRLDSWRRHE